MHKLPCLQDLKISNQASIPNLARGIFAEIGEDSTREGLQRTPERFYKALKDLTVGYSLTAEDVVGEGIFETESSGIICVKDIEFYSLCEHHMLPFWGQASIAYIPNKKILGLSKLARILDVYARRLQVQERLTKEVADSVYKLVDAKAVAITIQAKHMCMMMRGVEKQSATTNTEYLIGSSEISDDQKARLWKQFEK